MCGRSAASIAEERYQQIKPIAEPLPSLSMGEKKKRQPKYGRVRTGQERRTTMLNVGYSNG
jgi:hypothetical protein